MKNPSKLIVVAGLALAAGLAGGCSTFKSRANQKAEVFNALPADTQQRLAKGRISPGDTQDMVYIALGDPDEKRESVTAGSGGRSVWIYKTYWQQYEGTEWLGWHRTIVPAGDGRGYIIYHEPITRDVYRTHADEHIRVTFNDDKVESVDQAKN